MEFIIRYWYIFAIIAAFLLLGLLGYILDRKRYEKYKKEIIESGGADTVQMDNPLEPPKEETTEPTK
jgi:hypothetical protein